MLARIRLAAILLVAACARQQPEFVELPAPFIPPSEPEVVEIPEEAPAPPPDVIEQAPVPLLPPTPDPVRDAPPPLEVPEWYVVQYGDSLNAIAGRMGIGAAQILTENGLSNPDFLAVGQVLRMPTPIPRSPTPSFKIIPDSELVYGPNAAEFDVAELIAAWDGALNQYQDLADGELMSGSDIVQRVVEKYSVNPRLLLALLEYQAGWLTQPSPAPDRAIYSLGHFSPGFEGLYSQLSWAADHLNRGYYLWRAGWAGPFVLPDGSNANPGPGINAGTAAIQYLFSRLYPHDAWRSVLEENGFYRVYEILFGNPFHTGVDPLVPADLEQPVLQLPFEPGAVWSFTGGPHSAWGNWSAWSALDFGPPGDAVGCVVSNEWIVAVADGLVVRSDEGEVIQDLDGDGHESTGWVIQYLHVETRDRVAAGAYLSAGDRIGHPSCEGGISSGTHLHIARRYNGEWITADQQVPFVMDGWVPVGTDFPYDGSLRRAGQVLEACACRDPINQIRR